MSPVCLFFILTSTGLDRFHLNVFLAVMVIVAGAAFAAYSEAGTKECVNTTVHTRVHCLLFQAGFTVVKKNKRIKERREKKRFFYYYYGWVRDDT